MSPEVEKTQNVSDLPAPGVQQSSSASFSMAYKKSLVEAAFKVLSEHEICCNPAERLVVGRESEFVDDRTDERYPFTIWIAHGIIYLHIACHGEVHSFASGAVLNAIYKAVDNTMQGSYFSSLTGERTQIKNNLECHSTFGKEDDGKLKIIHHEKQFLVLAIEAAYNHEDAHTLLCEASSWLHTDTCCYVLLIKHWSMHPERGICVMLLRRIHDKYDAEFIQDPQSLELLGEPQKRYCGEVPKIPEFTGPRASWRLPLDPTLIMQLYDMEHVKSFYARSADEMQELILDMEFMFDRIAPDVHIDEPLLVVNLAEKFINYFAIHGHRA